MNNKRKFAIGRKKKQFDHRINFKTKKTGSEKYFFRNFMKFYSNMIFRLGQNKLFALLKDTLPNEEIDKTSNQNENPPFYENCDMENDEIEGNGNEMFFDEVEVSDFYNDDFFQLRYSKHFQLQAENNALCDRFNERNDEKSYDFCDENCLSDALVVEANDVEKVNVERQSIPSYVASDASDVEDNNFENIDTDGHYNYEEQCTSDMAFSDYDTDSECESDMGLPDTSVSTACSMPQVVT